MPSDCSARAIGSQSSGRGTPTSIAEGRAGFSSGPRMLKMVRWPFAAHNFRAGRDVFECRMKIRREEKREAMFAQRESRVRRRQIHADAELLNHIRAADR